MFIRILFHGFFVVITLSFCTTGAIHAATTITLILTLAQLIFTKQKLDLADFHIIIDVDESITFFN